MPWTLVLLLFVIFVVQTGILVYAEDINLSPQARFSSKSDTIGFYEGEVSFDLPMDASFLVGSVELDLSVGLDAVSSFVRFDVLSTLEKEVAALPESALKTDLQESLLKASEAIKAIKDAGDEISIDELYDQMKVLEKALDKQFIDLVDKATDLSPTNKARLFLVSKPIEQRYDYMKYITNKIRLYARDEVTDVFSGLIRQIVLNMADGDSVSYCANLGNLLKDVEKWRGTMIKAEEADRIRGKADLLLRKVGQRGVDQALVLDVITSIGDVEIDGGLNVSQDLYRAPSKDVFNQGFDFSVSYSSDEWSLDTDFVREEPNYDDRLKETSDRTKDGLGITISRTVELCTLDLSASFDREFYPQYIDNEIEEAKISQAIYEITELVDFMLSLELTSELEAELAEHLGSQGALGALAIGDRSETVDCLEDFIDELADAEWEGDIEEDEAETLTNMALAILPRRSIYDTDIPLSVAFPFRNADATVDLKWEKQVYPANAALDNNISSGKMGYTTDKEAYTLTGSVFSEKLIYPHAAAKNRSTVEWQAALDKDLSCGSASVTFFDQQRTYPLSHLKDRSIQQMDLDLGVESFEVNIDLSWMDKLTRHPNDKGKMAVEVIELEADFKWDAGQGTISISLGENEDWEAIASSMDLKDKVLVKRAREIEVSWDGEIVENLGLGLSLSWSDVTDFKDPGNDSQKMVVQVEFDMVL